MLLEAVLEMGITFACIAPHGTEVIPQLAGEKLEEFAKTRRAMEKMAVLMSKQKVETIVVATPHNLRLEGFIGVITSEFAQGTIQNMHGAITVRFTCDRALAREILQSARDAHLPVVGVNYGTSEGENSCMPMDWGTIIPLWFLGYSSLKKPQIVIVTPSREIPLENLVKFGNIIAKAAKNSNKKVAFIASADQGHAHNSKGPYGFHPASAKYDRLVQRAVRENNLESLLKLDSKFIEEAKPDSLWQIAILSGVLNVTPMKGRLISYEAPTYYGMLCAAYLP